MIGNCRANILCAISASTVVKGYADHQVDGFMAIARVLQEVTFSWNLFPSLQYIPVHLRKAPEQTDVTKHFCLILFFHCVSFFYPHSTNNTCKYQLKMTTGRCTGYRWQSFGRGEGLQTWPL